MKLLPRAVLAALLTIPLLGHRAPSSVEERVDRPAPFAIGGPRRRQCCPTLGSTTRQNFVGPILRPCEGRIEAVVSAIRDDNPGAVVLDYGCHIHIRASDVLTVTLAGLRWHLGPAFDLDTLEQSVAASRGWVRRSPEATTWTPDCPSCVSNCRAERGAKNGEPSPWQDHCRAGGTVGAKHGERPPSLL